MPLSHFVLIAISVLAAGGLSVAWLSAQAAAVPARATAAAMRRGKCRR